MTKEPKRAQALQTLLETGLRHHVLPVWASQSVQPCTLQGLVCLSFCRQDDGCLLSALELDDYLESWLGQKYQRRQIMALSTRSFTLYSWILLLCQEAR